MTCFNWCQVSFHEDLPRSPFSLVQKLPERITTSFIPIIKTSPLIALIGIISIHRPETTSCPLIINHTCCEYPHCWTAIFTVRSYLYAYLYIVTLTYWHMLSRCSTEHAPELLNTLPIILIFITFLLTSCNVQLPLIFISFRKGRNKKISTVFIKIRFLFSRKMSLIKNRLYLQKKSWQSMRY